jgi:hypothetical protein
MLFETEINLLQIKFKSPGHIGEKNDPLCVSRFKQGLGEYTFLIQSKEKKTLQSLHLVHHIKRKH